MGSCVGVQCSRPFGAVVGPAFKDLLAFFADLLGSDPSLDFGVGYVGWEVAGEPLANVGRGFEQVAGGGNVRWWGVRRGQPWLRAEIQKGGLRGVSRALENIKVRSESSCGRV